jgi:hypothetical protein
VVALAIEMIEEASRDWVEPSEEFLHWYSATTAPGSEEHLAYPATHLVEVSAAILYLGKNFRLAHLTIIWARVANYLWRVPKARPRLRILQFFEEDAP